MNSTINLCSSKGVFRISLLCWYDIYCVWHNGEFSLSNTWYCLLVICRNMQCSVLNTRAVLNIKLHTKVGNWSGQSCSFYLTWFLLNTFTLLRCVWYENEEKFNSSPLTNEEPAFATMPLPPRSFISCPVCCLTCTDNQFRCMESLTSVAFDENNVPLTRYVFHPLLNNPTRVCAHVSLMRGN